MTNRRNFRLPLTIALVALTSSLLLISWDFRQPSPFMNDFKNETDTIPKKGIKEKKIRDLDDVLDELNEVNLNVNMEKIKKEIDEAMKKIDGEKIKMEVEKAMREVDMAKIKQEIEASIAKIDWDKMQAQLKDEMSKLDIDMKKMHEELQKIGPEVEKSLENAKEEIEKAKAEVKEYKDFVDGLEQDGLLKRKDGYTIRHTDGELMVNDKKVSAEIYNKYRGFLEKHKKFTIEKSDDNFNIDDN